MSLRESLDLRQRLASRLLLALLAVCGVVLSIYVAREGNAATRALERLRIGEMIDTHFVAVSEHSWSAPISRKTVSRFFVPPPLVQGHPLGTFGAQALGLAPDLATVGWLPEVERRACRTVLESLVASGVAEPDLSRARGQPIDPEKLDRPMLSDHRHRAGAQPLRDRRRCRARSGAAARYSQRDGNARGARAPDRCGSCNRRKPARCCSMRRSLMRAAAFSA